MNTIKTLIFSLTLMTLSPVALAQRVPDDGRPEPIWSCHVAAGYDNDAARGTQQWIQGRMDPGSRIPDNQVKPVTTAQGKALGRTQVPTKNGQLNLEIESNVVFPGTFDRHTMAPEFGFDVIIRTIDTDGRMQEIYRTVVDRAAFYVEGHVYLNNDLSVLDVPFTQKFNSTLKEDRTSLYFFCAPRWPSNRPM